MLYLIPVALAAISLALAGVHYGTKAVHHRSYTRTLANIQRLEIDLGISEAPSVTAIRADVAAYLSYRERQEADRQKAAIPSPDPVYGDCEACLRRVQLNAGRCEIGRYEPCAKRLWEAAKLST